MSEFNKMRYFIIVTLILMEQSGLTTLYLLDDNHVSSCKNESPLCNLLDCKKFPLEALLNCPLACQLCVLTGAPTVNSTAPTAIIDACADKTNCTAFTNKALCHVSTLMPSAAKLCPKTCEFCTSCVDEDHLCNFMKTLCNQEIVQDTCPRSCGNCTEYDPATFLNNYQTTILTSTTTTTSTNSATEAITTTASAAATVTTTTITTTATTTTTSKTSLSTASLPPLNTMSCDKFGVIVAVAKGSVVASPMSSACSDGMHQPPEAVIQKYCSAPLVSKWASSVKVLDNCDRLPHYIPIAARTSEFGGLPQAAVFIKCEQGGFQAAMQTCDSVLKIYHVSTNSTAEIPGADNFVVLNWNN